MKRIVCFSGGKDSTAMLLILIEKGVPFNEIVYFDPGSWEFAEMKKHIKQVEKYIQRPIIRLKTEKSFDYWFWQHWPKGTHHQPGLGKSWPCFTRRWCTRVKTQTIDKYCGNALRYIGFAMDEAHRCNTKNIQKLNAEFPLINWNMTESDCLHFMYSRGFRVSGLYNHFDRVSCWCCPLQPLSSLYTLWKHYPEYWEKLAMMDRITWQQFRKDYSVGDLANKFSIKWASEQTSNRKDKCI